MRRKMKMHFLCVISVFSLIYSNQAQNIRDDVSNCHIEGISEDEWKTQKSFGDIRDNETDKAVFETTYTNIKSLSKDCEKYFSIKLNNTTNKLAIIPKNLTSVDGDYEKVDNDHVEITCTVYFICDIGKRSLTFKINVIDTNDYDPTFSEDEYIYKLPMPMSPKNSITNFGTKIIVTDKDFSNTKITCTTDFDEVSCDAVDGEKGTSSYEILLEFTTVEKLTSPKTITLTATDSGKPPRTSTAKVTINIDEENSEPPSFTKPSYLYTYDAKTPNIKPGSGQQAELESSMSGLTCAIQEESNYSPFFNDVVVDGTKIDLSLKKAFDDNILAEQIVQVTIECFVNKKIGYSTADVIIPLEKGSIGFVDKTYTATYEINGNNHEVNMAQPITIYGSLDDINIEVEDDLKTYFAVEQVDAEAEAEWKLKKKANLNEARLKNTEINFIITLLKKTSGKVIDEAFITLVLPNGEEGTEFAKPYFSGDCTYDDDGKGTMEPIKITLNNNNFDIDKCGLDENDEYSKYFEISCKTPTELNVAYTGVTLPEKLLESTTLPLSFWLDLKLGDINRRVKSVILLNFTYKGDSSSSTTTTTTSTTTTTTAAPSTETDDCSHTGWIIALIVVLLLFIAYASVTVFYYVKRIRNNTGTDSHLSNLPRRNTCVAPPNKRTSDKFKDISTRRPTGFIRYNPDQDRSSLDSEYDDAQKEVIENTNRNKYTNDPDESSRKFSDGKGNGGRNIGFVIPPPPPPPEPFNTR